MTEQKIFEEAKLPDNANYLRAVADLAEKRPMVAQSAIYSDSGVKLVEKGVRIDRRLYD